MEFGFELALCARLERDDAAGVETPVVARQLGGAVADPGSRVVDVVLLEPGPAFDERARITERAIPQEVIEADVGVGTAVPAREALDVHPDRVPGLVEAAVDRGVFVREREGGRTLVRRTARYPEDWFGDLVAVENKPDLGRPGDLERQLRHDVSLALFDRAYLATASHVTRAHLNRLPEAVGVWRFDPETGAREVVREASPLASDEPGLEVESTHPGRTDVALVSAAAKAEKRRRVAERAYGKGWRTHEFPGCLRCRATDDGIPVCGYHDRVVDPASECGSSCPGYEPDEPPGVDTDALRAARTPWVPNPTGVADRQAGLDRFG